VSRALLVRHGQSSWNAAGRWQGRADPPLSDLGIRQAEVVAEALAARGDAGDGIGAVWASPLQRARRTAEIIAARLELALTVDARLQERDAGEWTGLTRVEIEERWPGYLAGRRRPPAFEADDALLVRAGAILEEILDAPAAGGPPLVVTHGGLIRALENQLLGDSLPVPNLGGRELRRGADGLELGDHLTLVDPDAVEATTPHQI
jgi:broad specificity phosphatase PhoE